MCKRRLPRNPLFSRRRFTDDAIILCVRWYLRFKVSYRDLAEIAMELGLFVAPSTILRWVIRYAEEFANRWRRFERRVGRSWRADETYVKVRGKWMFLYRAVDQFGKTVESYLSRTRDVAAAKAFFRKALKHHGEPRTITLDGFEPSHAALRRMDAERVQLPMGESSQDPIIEISEQHGGTRSPAHQVPFTTYAGLQVVLQCTPCADRRRTASENQQEPVSCSRRIRSYWCCYMEQHSCQLIHASIRVA